MDYAQKIRRCNEYLEGLEEERRKIQVFQRELPLCLELVTQAIEVCKKEISGGSTTTDYMQVQSEGSEQTSSDHDSPVFEQFIPIKTSSENDDEDEQESHKTKKNIAATTGGGDKKKSDWLRSVQLWNNNNESPDPPSKEDVGKTGTAVEIKKNGGAFQPFHREKSTVEKSVGKGNVSATSTSTTESESRGRADDNGNANKKEEKESGQSQRKQRRCWSSELHRRFLHALQQLGGSHVATPKQIRELMEVDGLTNDEVKSHLQKYRLHSRRPSPSLHNNGNPQAPQFVVVGGIWVPPQEYASMTAAASVETAGVSPSPNNGIYAPVATLAQPSVRRSQRSESEERGSHSEGRVHSNSPSTSFSTHTTTDNSHVF